LLAHSLFPSCIDLAQRPSRKNMLIDSIVAEKRPSPVPGLLENRSLTVLTSGRHLDSTISAKRKGLFFFPPPVSLLLTPSVCNASHHLHLDHRSFFSSLLSFLSRRHFACRDFESIPRWCLLRRMDGGGNEGEPTTQTRRPAVRLPARRRRRRAAVSFN